LATAQEELQKQDRFHVLSKSIIEDLAYRGILDKPAKDDTLFANSPYSRRSWTPGCSFLSIFSWISSENEKTGSRIKEAKEL